ncbi:hypothetical protein BLS_001555 [Venturia inaequalis]|uniref:Uncharacterized protein n=1 Tax=Venturia inaequalis TaxID=5025 RepID=A0A8H3UYS0_VENIN|nr:hypothetical protein BLS_001555 [Venturia inaequalis]
MDTTTTATALTAHLAALPINSSQEESSLADNTNSTSRPELPAWNPSEMYTPAPSVASDTHCQQIENGINIDFEPGQGPWPMNTAKHGQFPVPFSEKHSYFCGCVWGRIPPPPVGEIWTPEARKYLAILWFHGDFHKEIGVRLDSAEWEEAHYHEMLSLILGYRVEQQQIFAAINRMQSNLPEEWVRAGKYSHYDPAVLFVFDMLNRNWLSFFRQFSIYGELNVEDIDEELEDGRA